MFLFLFKFFHHPIIYCFTGLYIIMGDCSLRVQYVVSTISSRVLPKIGKHCFPARPEVSLR